MDTSCRRCISRPPTSLLPSPKGRRGIYRTCAPLAFIAPFLLLFPPRGGAGEGRGHDFMAAQCPPHRESAFLHLQSWHRGFILCIVRVKAIFSSLLSLICPRIKGCGQWVEQQCAGPGEGCAPGAGVLRAAAIVCPVQAEGAGKGSC